MPAGTSGRVFISYRRQDARGSAGRIYDRFADDQVFMDVDNLPPGADFKRTSPRRSANAECYWPSSAHAGLTPRRGDGGGWMTW